MNGNEDGAQGKDSGTDLNQALIFESPPELCTCVCTGTCVWIGLRNVRDCARAGQEPGCDEHDQGGHDAPRVQDPTWRLHGGIPRGSLAGMGVVGNLQVAVVLNME